MNVGTELLKPLLQAGDSEVQGKVCIGSIKGDLHDIGKNLVRMMMEGKGLEVIDLGNDVAPERYVAVSYTHLQPAKTKAKQTNTTASVSNKFFFIFFPSNNFDKIPKQIAVKQLVI